MTTRVTTPSRADWRLYQAQSLTLAAQVEAFQSAAAKAGIDIVLSPQTVPTMDSLGGVCPGSPPCNWGIKMFANWLWDYGDTDVEPTGGQSFGTGNYWGGGFSSKQADALIKANAPGVRARSSLRLPELHLPPGSCSLVPHLGQPDLGREEHAARVAASADLRVPRVVELVLRLRGRSVVSWARVAPSPSGSLRADRAA